jgi:hypothetical protein
MSAPTRRLPSDIVLTLKQVRVQAPIAFVILFSVAAWFAPTSAATEECHGIQACIRVSGPWVLVPAHRVANYLLSCPQGRSVVGGLDAQATSRAVRVSFEGRMGAPVQPGQTTTRSALLRAVSTSGHAEAFRPLLGCIPTARQGGGGLGGGGRSTVSARITPTGLPLEFRARAIAISPGDVEFARISCLNTETRVGAWHAIGFGTAKPPNLARLRLVRAGHRLRGERSVVVTAASRETLAPNAHALVQVGTECAPR